LVLAAVVLVLPCEGGVVAAVVVVVVVVVAAATCASSSGGAKVAARIAYVPARSLGEELWRVNHSIRGQD
jgi:hypothetical protein